VTSAGRIDPRLRRQLDAASTDTLLHAVLIVGEDGDPSATPHDEGLAERVVEQIRVRLGEEAAQVRFVPRANAVIVVARPAFLRVLVNDPRVLLASATTIDLFPS